ncbi:hypothetical protein ACHAXN_005435 [Cyclotella atomus]
MGTVKIKLPSRTRLFHYLFRPLTIAYAATSMVLLFNFHWSVATYKYQLPSVILRSPNHQDDKIKVYAPSNSTPVQLVAYDQCIKSDAKDNTFVGLFDVDEFLVLKKHDNIVDFMNEYCNASCGQLKINWNMMGNSNETHYKPLPVLKRFVHSSGVMGFVKVIVRPDYAADKLQYLHSIQLKKGKTVDTSGKSVTNSGWRRQANNDGPEDSALFYHYKFKSLEEYEIKNCRRGHALDAGRAERHNCGKDLSLDFARNGTKFDNTAWMQLKRMVPKYTMFD